MVRSRGIDDERVACGGGGIVAVFVGFDGTRINKGVVCSADSRNPGCLRADCQARSTIAVSPKINDYVLGGIFVSETYVLQRAVVVLLVDDECSAERIISAENHAGRTGIEPVDVAVPLNGAFPG